MYKPVRIEDNCHTAWKLCAEKKHWHGERPHVPTSGREPAEGDDDHIIDRMQSLTSAIPPLRVNL